MTAHLLPTLPYLPIAEPVILLRRYKRFLADVRRADGTELTVHVPNSGAMTTCWEPGDRAVISDSGNDKRKLRHTLEVVRRGHHWVGVNTSVPNHAAAHFTEIGAISDLAGYQGLRREVRYGEGLKSRIDMLLTMSPDTDFSSRSPGELKGGDCFVEVKNTTLIDGIHGAFPDAKSDRARKHVMELAEVVRRGRLLSDGARIADGARPVRAVMLFFIGRADAQRFRPADEVDPAYGAALRAGLQAGVEALALRFEYAVQELDRPSASGLPLVSVSVRLLGRAEVDV